jgi:hypothetical protein
MALPALAALALATGALVFDAGSAIGEPSRKWLLASMLGFAGWRVAEACLHRARDIRLQRLANQSIRAHPALVDVPVRVALVPGSVAAFWMFTGWYRNYRFGALIYPKDEQQGAFTSLVDPDLRKLVESTLLAALLEHGWIREVDGWTLVTFSIDSPSGLFRVPARRLAALTRRSGIDAAGASRRHS